MKNWNWEKIIKKDFSGEDPLANAEDWEGVMQQVEKEYSRLWTLCTWRLGGRQSFDIKGILLRGDTGQKLKQEVCLEHRDLFPVCIAPDMDRQPCKQTTSWGNRKVSMVIIKERHDLVSRSLLLMLWRQEVSRIFWHHLTLGWQVFLDSLHLQHGRERVEGSERKARRRMDGTC